jgi:hypothetical protein
LSSSFLRQLPWPSAAREGGGFRENLKDLPGNRLVKRLRHRTVQSSTENESRISQRNGARTFRNCLRGQVWSQWNGLKAGKLITYGRGADRQIAESLLPVFLDFRRAQSCEAVQVDHVLPGEEFIDRGM